MTKVKMVIAGLLIMLLTACTTSNYKRCTINPDGSKEKVVLSHYSMGWDRDGVDLDLSKNKEKGVRAKIKVNKSNGSDAVVKGLETMQAGMDLIKEGL